MILFLPEEFPTPETLLAAAGKEMSIAQMNSNNKRVKHQIGYDVKVLKVEFCKR
jgi:hypothetical protein